jgi:hypothetical protein
MIVAVMAMSAIMTKNSIGQTPRGRNYDLKFPGHSLKRSLVNRIHGKTRDTSKRMSSTFKTDNLR